MQSKRYILIIIATLFLVTPLVLKSQDVQSGYEIDSINMLSSRLWKSKSDSVKMQLADSLQKRVVQLLNIPDSYNNNLDSLQGIARLRAAHSEFRILSWNTPFNDGTFRFDGIIQASSGKIFTMIRRGAFPYINQDQKIRTTDWYGAVYYSLIEKEENGRVVYTLLGWNGNTATSNLKIIDILSFDSSGEPVFGDYIFKTQKGVKPRVLIEYAENASALVRYDRQTLVEQKGKRLKESDEWMIVMDRLAPMSQGMEGMRKYYVPTGDTYDAYIFRSGFWVLAEDIKVANPVINGTPAAGQRK